MRHSKCYRPLMNLKDPGNEAPFLYWVQRDSYSRIILGEKSAFSTNIK